MNALSDCPAVLAAYMERNAALKYPTSWDAHAIRTRSLRARELLARVASDRGMGFEGVTELASVMALAHPIEADVLRWRSLKPIPLLRLAKMLVSQAILPADVPQALDIYRALDRIHGPGTVAKRHAVMYAQVALALGEQVSAYRLTKAMPGSVPERAFLWCDLLNPFVGSRYGNLEQWTAAFNAPFAQAGVEPICIPSANGEEQESPFDRLQCQAEAGSATGPLVTVVMSTWCPDEALRTAMGSLIRQTWANMEILLVDDASPDEYLQLLQEVASSDPRIRLIRQEANAGTYSARNRGLAEATGDYFTVQDSDDWCHPRRIERQVLALESRADLVASHCRGLRTSERMLFNVPGVLAWRTNESSLMFRTRLVRERIGFYDESRKGADTEFSIRLRHAFGQEAYAELAEVLTVIRLGSDSLSRSEFRPGWRHPARSAYRRAFEAWHGSQLNEGTGLKLASGNARRPFVLPARFRVHKKDGPLQTEALFVADLRPESRLVESVLDDMMALRHAGCSVAVLHMQSFMRLSLRGIDAFWHPLRRLIDQGELTEVQSTDEVCAERLFVTDPDLLQFAAHDEVNVRAGETFIVASCGPQAADGLLSFDVRTCENTAAAMFAAQPRWVARNAWVHGMLSRHVPAKKLSRQCWPSALYPRVWSVPQGFAGTSTGVELNACRDIDEQLGRLEELREDSIQVWVDDPLGGCAKSCLPIHWRMHTPVTTEKPTFMARLAAWVYLEPRKDNDVVPPGALQAIARGALPVLDPSWREVLGDAALYPAPGRLREGLRVALQDEQAYRALKCEGLKIVSRHTGAIWFDELEKTLTGFPH